MGSYYRFFYLSQLSLFKLWSQKSRNRMDSNRKDNSTSRFKSWSSFKCILFLLSFLCQKMIIQAFQFPQAENQKDLEPIFVSALLCQKIMLVHFKFKFRIDSVYQSHHHLPCQNYHVPLLTSLLPLPLLPSVSSQHSNLSNPASQMVSNALTKCSDFPVHTG